MSGVVVDWGCFACLTYAEAERAALEDRPEMPAHTLGRGCKCVAPVSDAEQDAIDRARERLREWREATGGMRR